MRYTFRNPLESNETLKVRFALRRSMTDRFLMDGVEEADDEEEECPAVTEDLDLMDSENADGIR